MGVPIPLGICLCGPTPGSPSWGENRPPQCSRKFAEMDSNRAGESWPVDEEEAFKAPIRDQYETQGHPYYASARLWDDGIIDPADSRRVLGLALSSTLNAPIEPTRFGVFRM